ncbi:DUF1614 domain-containing protein [Natranaerobius thermophilus]|uniref:DUF1614 domain-containing protein n=1 Tax=Natranaerobius thermophilus (strain ATCC BAA-1301 / DSM 18059 / JW/NM-WN-LF) TaxID=457570 RepID=B2A4N5_NATTJ|nr:DUF1614 domain-containing protein [Natranaerobius thermophilus]ACB85210.1 protein of unknown function DUF1614 [Natranaerobius thermophilus JW/NM-WN-LF]
MFYGYVLLLAVAALVYFGVLQRVLDRMGLTDKIALWFIAAMIIGGFLPDIPLADNFAINIGGGIVPLVLVGYLFYKADNRERLRSALAAVITGIAIFYAMRILPLEPTYAGILDPTFTFGIIAGVIAYIAGRSRRGAFIAGITGIVLSDIFAMADVFIRGVQGTTIIGGAGIFDAVVLAGLISVGLAEIVGESYERLTGGPDQKDDDNLGDRDRSQTQDFKPDLSLQETSEELTQSEVKEDEDKNSDDT